MPPHATGAAFVDRSGAVVAVDPGFAAQLGLDGDPAAALRARVDATPELRALLAGEGPAVTHVAGPHGDVELERVASAAGTLVVAREQDGADWPEHAMRSHGLTRLAAGLAHDIKNPLNAMALQIALLTDKLSNGPDGGIASAGHLTALREQIGRVNEVVRRFLDVTDPSAPLGYTDVGALLADVASLFGHDGRRRRIELGIEAGAGPARTRCDPARVGRVLLGLFSRAMAETPDGGRLVARAAVQGPDVVVSIEHVVGDPDPELGYYSAVVAGAARALGGALAMNTRCGTEHIELRLPRDEHP